MPEYCHIMPNPNIELQRLRAKQIKVLAKVGTNLARAIRNLTADHLAGLSNEDVAAVLSTDAVKKALGNVGSTKVLAVKVKPTTAKAKGAVGKVKVKRTRRSKVTDENILEFLKTERSAGEIAKKLGQLIPKRVAGLVKADKVVLRKAGIKKFYKTK